MKGPLTLVGLTTYTGWTRMGANRVCMLTCGLMYDLVELTRPWLETHTDPVKVLPSQSIGLDGGIPTCQRTELI